MAIAHIGTRSNRTKKYKSYNMDFKSQIHFDRWYDKVSLNSKIISIIWDDDNDKYL